jgi:Flp pilus assembly protein TadG
MTEDAMTTRDTSVKGRAGKNRLAEFVCRLRDERAAQIVEFAVALPLLMVFVVGIFDFSSAYTLKQKMTNIARDAARIGAADPANDLLAPSTSALLPASVIDAYEAISGYLTSNQINQCGMTMNSNTGGSGRSWAMWTFTGTGNGCPGSGITVVINRAYYFPASTSGEQPAVSTCQQSQSAGAQTSLVATCVSIQYAYQWQFGRVSGLLGSNIVLPPTSNITAVAVAMNEN